MRKVDDYLVWIKNETQLLLDTTNDFKTKKAYGGVNWESVKGKYIQICPTEEAERIFSAVVDFSCKIPLKEQVRSKYIFVTHLFDFGSNPILREKLTTAIKIPFAIFNRKPSVETKWS